MARRPLPRSGRALADKGIAPVVLGAAAEAGLAAEIPGAIDLIGQTGFGDLAALARAAQVCRRQRHRTDAFDRHRGMPSVTLFSKDSDPSHCAPVGPRTRVLQRPDLADLPVEAVLECLPERMQA